MVDAPVSGGIAAAEGGTLTFMVGGERRRSSGPSRSWSQMGKAVIHAGGPGAGQAAKICNNMLLGASMIATCETFVLAQKLGSTRRPSSTSRPSVRPMLVDDELLPVPGVEARRRRPTAIMTAVSRPP
jgi:hypothetical protein